MPCTWRAGTRLSPWMPIARTRRVLVPCAPPHAHVAFPSCSLAQALELAKAQPEACAASLQEESRATIVSLQNTWRRVALQAGVRKPFRLNPSVMFIVTGVLKRAQYRSAANYLCAAKRAHLEAGHPCGPQHEQAFRQAVRAAGATWLHPSKPRPSRLTLCHGTPAQHPRHPKARCGQGRRACWRPGGYCARSRRATPRSATYAGNSHSKWFTGDCPARRPTRRLSAPNALTRVAAKPTGPGLCPYHVLRDHVAQVPGSADTPPEPQGRNG